jgi:uncharacterized membrane protein
MKVLLAGESWFTYSVHQKGFDSFTTGEYEEGRKWLEDALLSGGVGVDYIPNHVAAADFPSSLEALRKYEVVILSDIGSNTLLFHPRTLKQSAIMPNRLRLLEEYVAGGGGFIMCGGWMSYQGIEAKANYKGSPIEELLPIEMLSKDDRVEVPEGFRPKIINSSHPILKGVPAEWPPFLFYNRFSLKAGATEIARNGADPVIAVHSYRHGRAMAFAMDIAPHGATPEFLEWEYFQRFWLQVVNWLAGKNP